MNGNEWNLSSRDIVILKSIYDGKTNEQIGSELNLSRHTIKANVANILKKMEVKDRFQAVLKAIIEKIIEI